MSMDNSKFPFVWMSLVHEPGHDFRQDFEEFEANLKRGEPFVLLTDSAPSEDHEHSQEEKKYTSLWMKKHKVELRKLVLAMILIEPSAAKRVAFKAFGVVFAKFWGYPLILASSREEALETAEKLLSRSGTPAVA
ncbi:MULTISPECIES: hypothetical protein [Agrobacterium]|uniref:hypothetical protein n=1 Tax=Agrobacterium tumefaciens TaxID=358 RepID=UPI000EF1A1AA|nr:hypothetical protein At1D1108_50800 [Agrobacterium tumefaciens]NSY09822.1 hypothetical protein [Agrobacterium tumefaciens]NSY93321.1 hypothetical protein [Agrobacterium tumefaciens]